MTDRETEHTIIIDDEEYSPESKEVEFYMKGYDDGKNSFEQYHYGIQTTQPTVTEIILFFIAFFEFVLILFLL